MKTPTPPPSLASSTTLSTVLDMIEEEGILDHVVQMGEHLQRRAQALREHAIVGEVRCKGLMMGVELVRDRATKEPFPAAQGVARRVAEMALEKGLHISATSGVADWVDGDELRFYPPLIIRREEIDEVLGIIDEALGQVAREVGLG